MKEIKLRRVREWFNKNFEYEILINDDEMLELSSGQEKMVELDSPVSIQARLWWCGSSKLVITESLDTIDSIAVGANKLTHGIAIFFIPILFIASALLNMIFPDLQSILIGVLIFGMVLSLALLTVWRKSWLVLSIEK